MAGSFSSRDSAASSRDSGRDRGGPRNPIDVLQPGGSTPHVLARPRKESCARIAAADERDAEHPREIHDNHSMKKNSLNGEDS